MLRIRKFLAFWYRLIPWVVKYPANSLLQRFQIMCDYIHLYNKKGLTRDEYYEFAFETKSKEFRDTFLGKNEQRHYLDLLNPVRYYTTARNKYIAHKILEAVGVKMATLYCYYCPEGSVANNDEIATDVKSVVRILKNKEVKSCIIKPTEESHGDNVVVIKSIEYYDDDCLLNLYNGDRKLLSQLLTKNPLIIESLISQTDQMANLNKSSVNTVRFMTTLYPNGSAKLVAAFIKIGREGQCVDNAGRGGNVDAGVDVHIGKLYHTIRYDGIRKVVPIEKHPDSNATIEGLIIDDWTDIVKRVLEYQQAFPFVKAAGWDIAITNDGPVVVEVNDMWDRTGQLFLGRGWRNEIRDCYKAWKSCGVSYPMYRQANELLYSQLSKIERYESC